MDPAPENEPVPVAAAPEMESAPDTAVAEMESAPETAVAEMEPEMEPAPETAVAKNEAWEIPAWSKHLRSRRGGGNFLPEGTVEAAVAEAVEAGTKRWKPEHMQIMRGNMNGNGIPTA